MSTPCHLILKSIQHDTTVLTNPKHLDSSCQRELQDKKYKTPLIFIVKLPTVVQCVHVCNVFKYANKATQEKTEHPKAGKEREHLSSEPSWKRCFLGWGGILQIPLQESYFWGPRQIAQKEHHQRVRPQRARCR